MAKTSLQTECCVGLPEAGLRCKESYYEMVRPGPDLQARLLRRTQRLRNELVLRVAKACALKPVVVRRAGAGGLLKREHWENLASYLGCPGLADDVKARWHAHRFSVGQKLLKNRQERIERCRKGLR